MSSLACRLAVSFGMFFVSGTLAENSRLTRAQGVVKAYMTIMSAYRGEVPCTVTTATVSRGICSFHLNESMLDIHVVNVSYISLVCGCKFGHNTWR